MNLATHNQWSCGDLSGNLLSVNGGRLTVIHYMATNGDNSIKMIKPSVLTYGMRVYIIPEIDESMLNKTVIFKVDVLDYNYVPSLLIILDGEYVASVNCSKGTITLSTTVTSTNMVCNVMLSKSEVEYYAIFDNIQVFIQ